MEEKKSVSPLFIFGIALLFISLLFGGIFGYRYYASYDEREYEKKVAKSLAKVEEFSREMEKKTPEEQAKIYAEMDKADKLRIEKEKELINGFLADQQKGIDSKSKFCAESNSISLPGVTSWEVRAESETGIVYTVKVNASNKDSQKVNVLYFVSVLERNNKLCISVVEEKQ